MHTLFQDLRYSARQLRMNLGFTVLVTLTVALGIGANTAIFSLVNGYLRPLPVKDPEQLVVLAAQTPGDQTGFAFTFSWLALEDYRRQTEGFSDLFGFTMNLGGFSTGSKALQFLYANVTGNFFTGLRMRPAAGRLFLPGEGEKLGSEHNAVISHRFWRSKLGADPSVVGREARIDGRTVRIIGVTPPEFHGMYAGAEMDGYLPFSFIKSPSDPDNPFALRRWRALTVVGRKKPGVTLAKAQTSVDVVARRLRQTYPEEKGITVRVFPETLARPVPIHFLADAIPVIRGFLLLLAAMVLLLACMNVANLLLVRATIREREMAIRAALGSGRARLVRQMLTESLMLALLGGLAGIAIGKWGSDGLARSIAPATDFPVLIDFSFDWRVFGYALAAAVITGILIGLWPAVRVSRTQANAVLHEGGRAGSSGPQRQRLRGFLVVGQVGGSLVLLVVAGLSMRSLREAQRMDYGFKPDRVLNLRMNPRWAGYAPQRIKDYYREVERRAKAVPGVESASLAFSVPMSYYFTGARVFVEDHPVPPGEPEPMVGYNPVSPGYFDTLQIRMMRGRVFGGTDTETSPKVAIVNQTMAARFWPGQDPVGKRLRMGSREEAAIEVVGVAHDSKYLAVFEHALPYFYVPLAQTSFEMRVLQVRTSVAPETLAARLQSEIEEVGPEVPLADLQTFRQALGGAFGTMIFRVGALQSAATGLLGLVLAVIGVYGVVSYGAAQRTREIGIRMALGAFPSDIRRLILRQGVFLVAAGVVLGIGAAAAITRVIARYVLLVSGTDPVTFMAVVLLLGGIALGACYLPARRAMKVDPMVALRHE